MGFGGPHAGFTRVFGQYSDAGRIIGVTVDSKESLALRMAMRMRRQLLFVVTRPRPTFARPKALL
jgi:glycine cleavage system pyridoxal-binding protein P